MADLHARAGRMRPRRWLHAGAIAVAGIALTILAVLFPGAAGAQPAPVPVVAPPAVVLPPELDRVLRDYERAWRDGDGAALAALFLEDGFAVQSGSPLARGRDAIAKNIDGPGGALQLSAYAFAVSESTGYIVGGFRYPETIGPGGRFVLALHKRQDGFWLIAADLDNMGPRPKPGTTTPAPTAAPADDRALLVRLNEDYVKSVLHSDAARFEQLLAVEFRNTNPDGAILDRAAFLAQVARPSNLKSLACEDVEIRVLGDTAIIHAKTVYETSDGRAGNGRYTDIWQKRNGEWKAVAAHVTRLVR
jgi:ketosteroid isomerase-like protein